MKKRRIGAVAAAAAVIVLALVAATAAPGGVAVRAATVTFTDPTGDGGGGADIVAVSLADTTAGSFQIAVTLTGALQPSQSMNVFMDTDRNESTGSSSGGEFALAAWTESDGNSYWDAATWQGSSWVSVPQSSTMHYSRSGATYTWQLASADLGGKTSFDFYTGAYNEDSSGSPTTKDFAPDGGRWHFDLAAAAPAPAPTPTTPAPVPAPAVLKPVIGTPKMSLPAPKAGKLFAVRFPVTRSDDGKPLTTGTMVCDPSVNGKVVPHSEQFAGGIARLSFTVPKSAKGKLLKVKVTIKLDNQAVTRIASFHVR